MKREKGSIHSNEVIRVIVDGPRDPRLNMSIDEAIARLRYDVGYDTLRIYMWKPTGVSIGRRQDPYREINIQAVEENKYVLVRRPTGGSALIHKEGGELTYSVVLSSSHPFYNLDIATSASAIATGIANAVKALGLNADIGTFKGVDESSLCYVRSGTSDVVVMGKKISGSAQRRSWNILLQHGTFLLDFDKAEWVDVIKVSEKDRYLLDNIAGIYQLLNTNIDLKDIIDTLIDSMVNALGFKDYFMGSFTPKEIDLSWKLYRSKYSTDKWNIQGIEDNDL